MPKLITIPVSLNAYDHAFHAPVVMEVVNRVKQGIVENAKPARSHIKALCPNAVIREYTLFELGKSADSNELLRWMRSLEGEEVFLMSDAGSPCIADPGYHAVWAAHQLGWSVHSLPGASSIMLALSNSGFSGQSFAFSGYLPIEKAQRKKAIHELWKAQQRNRQTQIFMETPYRSDAMLQDLITHLPPQVHLHISADLFSPSSMAITQTLASWAKNPPSLHKRPCIFVLGSRPQ